MRIWLLAIRPRTLTAGAVPVAVGIAAASLRGPIDAAIATTTLAAALFLQIASNLANDYYDHLSGVDTSERVGPVRVTQAGLLAPQTVKRGLYLVLIAAALCGVPLVVVGGLPILSIGLASLIGAVAYSAGPWPLSRHGFGEPMAFLFFGVVAVCGTYLLQRDVADTVAVLASIPIGCLAAALISVNNLRDAETDRAAGKHTISVRFGETVGRRMYVALIGVAYVFAGWFAFRYAAGVFVVGVTAPLAVRECVKLFRRAGGELNESLAGTARLELFFGLAFVAGVFL